MNAPAPVSPLGCATRIMKSFQFFEEARGMDDDPIIEKAFAENWILITNDNDFGEKVYREGRPHRGVVFMRLKDERTFVKISVIQRLLAGYAEQLADKFVVVTETKIRFARK